MVAGDFNRDGRTDFAVVNSGSGNVSILLAGTPPSLSCNPASLSVTVSDPNQLIVSQFCDVNSSPSGITLNVSAEPVVYPGNWGYPVLDSYVTPTILQTYVDVGSVQPIIYNESIDLWDAASGFHVRVPTNLTVSPSICANTYTFSVPSVTAPSFGSSGVFSFVKNNPSCPFSISSDSSWLTGALNPPGYEGSFIGYQVALNSGPPRAGNLIIGLQEVPFTQAGTSPSLTPVSVSPSNGSGAAQTFQFVFTDTAGAADLSAQIWFTGSPGADASATCKLYYVAATNQLHLVDDTGLSESSGTLGTSGSLQNHQCSVDAGNSTASWSGTTLTLTIPMTFSAALAGPLPIWMNAAGIANSSGWNQEGSWTVTASPGVLSVISAKPCCGTGISQTFTFTFADTSGAHSVQTTEVWFTPAFSSGSAAGTCQISFSPASYQFGLLNDSGTAWMLGGPSSTLQNSQCSFTAFAIEEGYPGNQFYWSITITFTPAFGGVKQIWMYAADAAGNNSGWQQFGTWTVASQLQISSLSPANGSGTQQVFQIALSDPSVGAYSLQYVEILINSTLSPANGCDVRIASSYGVPTASVRSNDGTQWLSQPQNSQCTVDPNGVHQSGFFTSVLIEFKPGFSGPKVVYVAASDANNTLGLQPMGTYTVLSQPAVAPQVVSANPSSGYGSSINTTLVFSDLLTVGDISSVNILFGAGTASLANSCALSINPTAYTIQLANDSGTWLGAQSIFSFQLQNSQCTILLAQVTQFSSAGTQLTVTLTVTFQPAFSAVTNFYAQANSLTGTSSGWQLLGTWGPYNPITQDVSVSPASGSGLTQTFTFTYSFVEGASYISELWIMFGNPPAGANLYSTQVPNVCFLLYNPQLNSLILVDDTTLHGYSGTLGSAKYLNNSACGVNLAHASIAINGNTLVFQVPVTFSYDYAGSQGIWMTALVEGTGGPLTQMGTWTVPASPVSMTAVPSHAVYGQPVTFTASLKAGGGTGTMTFVDRYNILGTGVMSAGTATFPPFPCRSGLIGLRHITRATAAIRPTSRQPFPRR